MCTGPVVKLDAICTRVAFTSTVHHACPQGTLKNAYSMRFTIPGRCIENNMCIQDSSIMAHDPTSHAWIPFSPECTSSEVQRFSPNQVEHPKCIL